MSILPIAPLLFVILVYINNYRITSGVLFLIGFLFVLSFTIFYGARDLYSGTDSYRYALAFEGSFSSIHWEVGYQFWLAVLRAINPSYAFFFLFSAFFSFFLYLLASLAASRQYGREVSLLLFVLLCYSGVTFDLTTNGMRQGLGLSFAVLSVPMICSKRPIVGLILMLFASLVHNSFWVLFLFAAFWTLFTSLRLSIFYPLLVGSVVALLLVVVGVDIFSLLLGVVSLDWLPGNLHGKLAMYSELSKGSFGELNFFGRMNVILYSLVIVFFGFLAVFKKNRNTDYTLFVTSGGLFCLLIYFLMAYQAYSYRYLYLCTVFFPFLVGEWIYVLRNKFRFLGLDAYCTSVLLLSLIAFMYFVLGSSNLQEFKYFV